MANTVIVSESLWPTESVTDSVTAEDSPKTSLLALASPHSNEEPAQPRPAGDRDRR